MISKTFPVTGFKILISDIPHRHPAIGKEAFNKIIFPIKNLNSLVAEQVAAAL